MPSEDELEPAGGHHPAGRQRAQGTALRRRRPAAGRRRDAGGDGRLDRAPAECRDRGRLPRAATCSAYATCWRSIRPDRDDLRLPRHQPVTHPRLQPVCRPRIRRRSSTRSSAPTCWSTTPTRASIPRSCGSSRRPRWIPGRAGHQADHLPHQQGLADRARAGRGRPARQAGGGAGGDHRPLRRGAEHRLGRVPGERGRPRRLRRGEAQDPRQAGAGGARGGGAGSGATPTSAPATTTPARPASTRTSACSPPTPRSATTWPRSSTS